MTTCDDASRLFCRVWLENFLQALIAALLSNPEALKNLKAPREFHFGLGKNVDWNVKYAFFTGPRSFVVDRDGIKLRFHFTASGWQLHDLDLGLIDEKR